MIKKYFSKAIFASVLMGSIVFTGCQNAAVQPPAEKPEIVIQNGLTELSKVEAYSLDLSMNMDANDPNSSLEKLTMNIDGFVDMKDIKNPKISLALEGSGNEKSGTKGSAAMDIQFNKDVFFFNVNKVDLGTPVPAQFASMIGKWWKITIPEEGLQEMNKVLEQAQSGKNTAEQEKMKKLLEENNFFAQPTFVTTEDVKGEPSIKYNITIDKDKLIQFLTKYNESQTTSTLTAQDIKSFEEGLKMAEITGSVWIGNNSKALNKVAFNIKVDDKATNSSGNIAMEATFWDFGKDFTVESHTDAQEFPIEQILAPLMFGGLNLDSPPQPNNTWLENSEPMSQEMPSN